LRFPIGIVVQGTCIKQVPLRVFLCPSEVLWPRDRPAFWFKVVKAQWLSICHHFAGLLVPVL
jgi:hypothetical protein